MSKAHCSRLVAEASHTSYTLLVEEVRRVKQGPRQKSVGRHSFLTFINHGLAFPRGRPDIQWTNLDPQRLLEELGPFASLEGFRELLEKAQVGQAYVGRPCLDPDDPHCPPSAPNHHSRQVGSWPDLPRKDSFPFISLPCVSVF